LREIEKGRATLFDATVVDACLRLFRERGFHLEDAGSAQNFSSSRR
jgi:hypothetical protein